MLPYVSLELSVMPPPAGGAAASAAGGAGSVGVPASPLPGATSVEAPRRARVWPSVGCRLLHALDGAIAPHAEAGSHRVVGQEPREQTAPRAMLQAPPRAVMGERRCAAHRTKRGSVAGLRRCGQRVFRGSRLHVQAGRRAVSTALRPAQCCAPGLRRLPQVLRLEHGASSAA